MLTSTFGEPSTSLYIYSPSGVLYPLEPSVIVWNIMIKQWRVISRNQYKKVWRNGKNYINMNENTGF